MHNKIGQNSSCTAWRLCMHAEFIANMLDCGHCVVRPHINSDLAKFLHQPSDKIRVEPHQHPCGALKYDDLCARACRDMRELRCYIAAADHYDPLGKALKLQEGVAFNGVLRARKAELNRARARGNHDGAALENATFDRDRVRSNEASEAVKGLDALLGETRLHLAWYRIGEGALERDQSPPVDMNVSHHAMLVHAARPIDGLGSTHQHLLRIATTQRTGPAKRAM